MATSFSLEGRALKLTTAEDIAPYLGPLSDASDPAHPVSGITSISLVGNTLGVPAAQALSVHLPTLKNLERANLADIFTARLLSEIPPALDALLTSLLPLEKLSEINLSDNAFGLNTAAPLVAFLEKHSPLRNLILNNNGLGPEAGTLVATALTKLASVQGGGKLEAVVCGRNRLENGSMPAWADAYAAHAETLRSVRMTQNGIRPEGIVALLGGLRHAKKLQVLDLQDNTFTHVGVKALVGSIGEWAGLVELGVGDCLLGKKMVWVFEELGKGKNQSIEVLKLAFNEIDAKGVKALVSVVEGGSLPKLRRVELNGNKFAEDDESVERLREILGERRDKAGVEEDSEEWGIDELDELESDDEEDDDEEEEEDVVKDAEEEEQQNVAQDADKEVDELAARLGKTGL